MSRPTSASGDPRASELSDLTRRLDAAVDETLVGGARERLEHVLTDGYTEVLRLESDRKRARRRLEDGLARVAEDPTAATGAAGLCEEIAELTAQLWNLRSLLDAAKRRGQLHAA